MRARTGGRVDVRGPPGAWEQVRGLVQPSYGAALQLRVRGERERAEGRFGRAWACHEAAADFHEGAALGADERRELWERWLAGAPAPTHEERAAAVVLRWELAAVR